MGVHRLALAVHGCEGQQFEVEGVEGGDVLLGGEELQRAGAGRGAEPLPALRVAQQRQAGAGERPRVARGTTSPVPPMTSTTAPASVDTVARAQSMASTRPRGKPSTTLDSTLTHPAA